MYRLRIGARSLAFATTLGLAVVLPYGTSQAATSAQELDGESNASLQLLYKSNPAALALSKKAKAILVFPKMIKAGLVFGGAYGEGVLLDGARPDEYFNSVSASWGLQAGAQTYGYALFLMNSKALGYLHRTEGWELGVGPTVVVVDDGIAKNLSTSTLKNDAYAVIFDQQGLMGSLSIEGTKVTRIKP